MKTNTENNKADVNKCVCLIYLEGECEMITRNCFGEITPRIGKYIVEKRHDGKWEINKEEYCLKTTTAIANEVMLWIDIEPFDSMVKAYAWLKKHVNELL